MVYHDGTFKAAPSRVCNPPREVTPKIRTNPPKIDNNRTTNRYGVVRTTTTVICSSIYIDYALVCVVTAVDMCRASSVVFIL